MKLACLVLIVLGASFLGGSYAQIPQDPVTGLPIPRSDDHYQKLPNGKSQKEEILKADYKKNLEDAAELVKLSQDLQSDLMKDDRYVVSVKTLKKTDDIERLAKNIRGRLKRF